jgi:hypothetical protein
MTDGTGLGSFPIEDFGSIAVEPSSFITRKTVNSLIFKVYT